MAEEASRREYDPVASPSARICVLWYFRRGWLTLLTIPLFVLLLTAFCESIIDGAEIVIALIRASDAVMGFVGAFIAVSFGWILAFLPLAFYYGLLRNVPGLWLRRDVTIGAIWKFALTVGMLILFIGLGDVVAFMNYHAVGWIADRNPCAAFKAGVIGSIPPPPDCH